MYTVEKPRLSLFWFLIVGLGLVLWAFIRDEINTHEKIDALEDKISELENPVRAEPRIIEESENTENTGGE